MRRGTRTQYLRRAHYLVFVAALLSLTMVFLGLILASTGGWRIVWFAVLPPIYILMLLLTISKLTDKQWFREHAELQQKANQRGADAVYLPGWPSTRATERALAFAKRLFGAGKSD